MVAKKTFGTLISFFFYVQRKIEVALFTCSTSQRDKAFTNMKFIQCFLDLTVLQVLLLLFVLLL